MTCAVVRTERGDDDAVRIVVTGEVDASNAAETERQVRAAVTGGLTAVTVDLTGLDYIDSAGLWLLFRLGSYLTELRIAGEVVVPADGPVRRMVEVAGVRAAVPVRWADR